jgi:hypothetical protein
MCESTHVAAGLKDCQLAATSWRKVVAVTGSWVKENLETGKVNTTSPIIYLSLDEPNPFCPYMFISDQGAPTFCSMEGQSGTSENRPEEEEYVEIEVEESPPEDEGLAVDVEKEITRPRSTYLPGAPRVGTNYKWPGLLKKAAPGYKSLPGFKDHDVQMARDLTRKGIKNSRGRSADGGSF